MITGGEISISSLSEVTISVSTKSIEVDAAGVAINGTKVDAAATGVATVTRALVKVN